MNSHRAQRAAYACLVFMHPPGFRRRFGPEMLWIFREAVNSESSFALFRDGFVSLARQWVLRSGSWKIAAALAGAVIQLAFGGILWLPHHHAHQSRAVAGPEFVRIALGSICFTVVMVTAVSLWVRNLTGKRMDRMVRARR